jgi:hypothetical protein
MESLTRFIERRLKLQINAEKSAVARPWHRTFLGFTVRNEPEFRRCIADKAIIRFKHRVRELTGRHRGITLERMIRELASYLRGWAGYFGLASGVSCNPSIAGFGGAFVASSGSSGRRVAGDIMNSGASEYPGQRPARPSSAQRGRGE